MKWNEFYEAAILETDWSKLEDRIEAVEAAIAGRLQEFSVDHGGTLVENQQIQDALHGLEALRRELEMWRSKAAG
jgi:hypothetical protein